MIKINANKAPYVIKMLLYTVMLQKKPPVSRRLLKLVSRYIIVPQFLILL